MASRWGVLASLALAGWLSGTACGHAAARETNPQASGQAGEAGAACTSCAEGGALGDAAGASAGGSPAEATNAGGVGSGGEAVVEVGAAGTPALLPTLVVRELAITQTVELPLMLEQQSVPAAQRNAPLVAGKRALVRAYVDLEPGFDSRPLLGVLDLKNGARSRAIVSELTPLKSSLKAELDSSFVFAVPASEITATSNYRLRVLEADTALLAQFPEVGYAELGARVLRPFQLVLVPMTINGFAPQAGRAELLAVQQRLLTLFPSAAIEVSLGDPLVLDYVLNADGDGWQRALEDLLDRRRASAPAERVFFYGLMAPAATYSAYCGSSCVLGLSHVAEPDVDAERGSIGISVFQDGSGAKDAWDTLAHELGHALGREHADCGDPDGPDPSYPYENGGMGTTYGYDFGVSKLIKPRPYRDVMSYCTPVWISDYTYRAVFERLQHIDDEAFRVLGWSPPETFRVAHVDRLGHSSWRGERSGRRRGSRLRAFELLDAGGRRVAEVRARFSRLDHLPGGSVWFAAQELAQPGAVAVDLRPFGGAVLSL